MKKLLCLTAVLLLLCTALTACGSDNSAADAAEVDLSALAQKMYDAAEWPQMLTLSSDDSNAQRGFGAVSDLDCEKVDAYRLWYAADGSAYELAVIRLKDKADAAALEQSLKKHIETRTEQYRIYKPEQVSRASGAVVAVRGDCAALIMCDDNAAVKAVFDGAF